MAYCIIIGSAVSNGVFACVQPPSAKEGDKMTEKTIPIGIEFYKQMIDKHYYYVDKTMMIKELLDHPASVSLFTRPRRFGKTLTLNMLKTFFEDERDLQGNKIDNSQYFKGKKIARCGEKYLQKMGQYPVISLSLKSVKQPDFEMAYESLQNEILREFRRHRYVCNEDILSEDEIERYKRMISNTVTAAESTSAIAILSECLKKYHQKNVIILIDEYDVPLENANFANFYDQMAAFIRSLFESALKTNENLEFAVITGCLQISKESIFTGLNNLKIISILRNDYAEYFGFTPKEVHRMLEDYGLADCEEEVQNWYNGYLFGETEVYNPWSVINYIDENRTKTKIFPRPYWSNTSSNSIVKDLIENADLNTKKEVESLIAGGTIEKPIHEDVTYEDIYDSQDNLWNFLFFTGYLKKISERMEDDILYFKMRIPNVEVRLIYRTTVLAWFGREVKKLELSSLVQAIEEGDCAVFGEFLSAQLLETISFFDYSENYYHGFLVGMLKAIGKYEVLSNRESGNGRPDIIMKSPSLRGKAFIMELKVAPSFQKMDIISEEAVCQAVEKNYLVEIEKEGYSDITVYGICFYKKECLVRKKE